MVVFSRRITSLLTLTPLFFLCACFPRENNLDKSFFNDKKWTKMTSADGKYEFFITGGSYGTYNEGIAKISNTYGISYLSFNIITDQYGSTYDCIRFFGSENFSTLSLEANLQSEESDNTKLIIKDGESYQSVLTLQEVLDEELDMRLLRGCRLKSTQAETIYRSHSSNSESIFINNGTYYTSVSESQSATLSFGDNNTFSISSNGNISSKGTYTMTRTSLVLNFGNNEAGESYSLEYEIQFVDKNSNWCNVF